MKMIDSKKVAMKIAELLQVEKCTVHESRIILVITQEIIDDTVRTDVFTYVTNLITEVRTLAAGGTITYKYHLDTLETEVI